MGVKIGGDTTKSGKNTHFLVIICFRLPQKIGLLNLKNHNQFKKGNNFKKYNKCAQVLQILFIVTYAVLLLHIHKCRPRWGLGMMMSVSVW